MMILNARTVNFYPTKYEKFVDITYRGEQAPNLSAFIVSPLLTPIAYIPTHKDHVVLGDISHTSGVLIGQNLDTGETSAISIELKKEDQDFFIDIDESQRPPKGTGLLSGSFPISLVTQEGGLPSQAEVRVHYRPEPGEGGDGILVATTTCNADGSWQVSDLDESLKYDIIARIPGYNDVIISDVQPAGAPLSAHFANLQEEYEYGEEVSIQVVALGGTPPYTFTVIELPEGLTFNSVTGYITGSMPAGDLTISITVADSVSDSVAVTWDGIVDNPLPTIIGEPFGGGYYAGTITYPDARVYLLVIADIAAEVTATLWKTTGSSTAGTDSAYDGFANTSAMDTAVHPAAQHCTEYAGGGEADWYLASSDEWQVIHDNLSPDITSAAEFQVGGSQAMSESTNQENAYWTSTQANSSNAYFMWLIYDFITTTQKYKGRRVRPIRRIQFTP